MSNKKFPKDCARDCPHYHSWDMSVDDWTNACDLLKVQIDDCDMDFNWMYCPLAEQESSEGMPDKGKIMSWLEGLAQQDWRMFHSDSEVSNIAKAALELLKEQQEKINKARLWLKADGVDLDEMCDKLN